MKLRSITGILMASVMAVGLVSCGHTEEMPDGEYVRIEVGENLSRFRGDVDKAMRKSSRAENFPIEFDDDSFELITGTGRSETIYTGTFEMDEKTGRIQFDYETARNSAWSKSEAVKAGKKYSDGIAKKLLSEEMEEMNKTGTYVNFAGPVTSVFKVGAHYAAMPQFVGHSDGALRAGNGKELLYKRGDLLCTKLYGVELDGSYKKGKDFTLNFDQLEVYKKDPNSTRKTGRSYGYMNEDDEFVKCTLEEYIMVYYDSKEITTTIKFSDGEWEFYNSEGDLMNDGEYLESDDYPGLISMYITDDSERNDQEYQIGAILLYIDDNNEILYPAFVKAD